MISGPEWRGGSVSPNFLDSVRTPMSLAFHAGAGVGARQRHACRHEMALSHDTAAFYIAPSLSRGWDPPSPLATCVNRASSSWRLDDGQFRELGIDSFRQMDNMLVCCLFAR